MNARALGHSPNPHEEEEKMSTAQLEQRVLASLENSLLAFNAGRPEFFDEFAEDAMIFTADSPEPIKGRETYRKEFEAAFTSQKREKTILDRTIQIVGDKAVVKQTATITQADASAKVLQTLVYGETGEGLKVLHSHTALMTPDAANGGAPAVQVLNEKIATTATVVGVAQ
jgi:ketosteroid isomerase-like protein